MSGNWTQAQPYCWRGHSLKPLAGALGAKNNVKLTQALTMIQQEPESQAPGAAGATSQSRIPA
jgi:hypothetical protein